MRKTDKKRENQIRDALTQACDRLLKYDMGFCWLTHRVDYDRFPQSLFVICIFENQQSIDNLRLQHQEQFVYSVINDKLSQIGIKLKSIASHVQLDSEEACEAEHDGNWALRLQDRLN